MGIDGLDQKKDARDMRTLQTEKKVSFIMEKEYGQLPGSPLFAELRTNKVNLLKNERRQVEILYAFFQLHQSFPFLVRHSYSN